MPLPFGDMPDPDAPAGWEVGWVECRQCGGVYTAVEQWAIVHQFKCPTCGGENDYMADTRRIELGLADPKVP